MSDERRRGWWPVAGELCSFFSRRDIEQATRPLPDGTRVKPGEIVRRGDSVGLDPSGLAVPLLPESERVRRWAEAWGWWRAPDGTFYKGSPWVGPERLHGLSEDVVILVEPAGAGHATVRDLADPAKGWTRASLADVVAAQGAADAAQGGENG